MANTYAAKVLGMYVEGEKEKYGERNKLFNEFIIVDTSQGDKAN